MKLYHGSKRIVEAPIYKGSNKDNDYGPAFYLTSDLDSAKEWACRNNSVGFVNEFSIDLDGLKVLDLTDKNKWSVINWIAILVHFRYFEPYFRKTYSKSLKFLEDKYYIDIEKYDVVIGFRADDAYFRFPLDFVSNQITINQLEYVYTLGNLGIQHVLISEKAIKSLKYKKTYLAENEYVDRYFQNVKRCTKTYDELSKEEYGERLIDLVKKNDLSGR